MKRSEVERSERTFKKNFISTLVKGFVLVSSLSLFVYRESVHMPAKKEKDPFCCSRKRASRKDSTKRKLFPKQRKIKLKKAIKDHIIHKRSSGRKNLMSG